MIFLPIIIIQTVTIIIFYERHWDNVSNNMEDYLISGIKTVVNYYTKYPKQVSILKDLNQLDFKIKLLNQSNVHKKAISNTLKRFQNKLNASLKYSSEVSYIKSKSEIRGLIFLNKNQILQIDFSSKRIQNKTTYIFVIWIVTTSILFGLISLFFMQNQVRSIIKLTKVAKAFGQGRKYHFIPSGAKEIRSLGISFLRMRENIERQIRYRTELLAHIAHDLRTPMTRIKLKLALLDKLEVANNISKNIDKMESMIKTYLNFAKQEGNEENKKHNLVAIIRNVIILFNDNRIVFNTDIENIEMYLKHHAIERALNNIIDNALKYASKIVEVNLSVDKEKVLIHIDDDGFGIAEEDYKTALEPFSKLPSSSQDGYGLGLTIAKNIINAHGGKFLLAKSKYSGLRVIIRLTK